MAPAAIEFIKLSRWQEANMLLSLNLNLSGIFFPLEEIEHVVLSIIKPSIIGENAGPKNRID